MGVAVSWTDIRYGATNNNRKIVLAAGASFSEASAAVYFVTSVEGSNIDLKDSTGAILVTVDDSRLWEPGTFRSDGGLGATNNSADPAEIYFFLVPAKV